MATHPAYGKMSKHHLVPSESLKLYYGKFFRMPNNIIRLWRFRHDAWHILFGNKSLNEIINYLNNRSNRIYGYKSPTWKILFHDKSAKDARKLLERTRQMIRKEYGFLEFDPKLQKKYKKMEDYLQAKILEKNDWHKKFMHP